jgi:flagellar biosynthesis protein FlhB
LALRYALDLQLFAGEKTEKATPKKKQEARQKGQVAKSNDVSAAVVLLSGLLSLLLFGSFYKERLVNLFKDFLLHRLTADVTAENVIHLFGSLTMQLALMLAPIFGVSLVTGILANYLQVGFLFTGDPLKPKFSKINPIKGFKNIFSMRTIVELFKSIFKLLVIAVIVYFTLSGARDNISKLGRMGLEQTLAYTSKLTMILGIQIGAALLVLAFADYMYQRYSHAKSLRMSKQDIKDEYKKMEGDPLIKGKIRERQRRMALQRMMQEIPKADVIITNPTHFAVALKYDGTAMEAPQVIAKGQDYVALRIREIAKEHGVITMENKPLARALFQRTEIGDSIPADLFQAVAEVLAYVYKLKGKVK